MRRAEALRALSRDHHRALVIARELKTGDENARRRFLEDWSLELQSHFGVEEGVLLPWWDLLGDLDEPATTRMCREHREIRAAAIALGASGRTSAVAMARLGKQIARHVRFEERELFPMIEADLDERRLARLAKALTAAADS